MDYTFFIKLFIHTILETSELLFKEPHSPHLQELLQLVSLLFGETGCGTISRYRDKEYSNYTMRVYKLKILLFCGMRINTVTSIERQKIMKPNNLIDVDKLS